MSFPTKVIPLSSACKTWLNQTYALKNHSHSDLSNSISDINGRLSTIENNNISYPDWQNTIILVSARNIHYSPPNTSGADWNSNYAHIKWGDYGILNGDYYEYKIGSTLICKLYKETVKTGYPNYNSNDQVNAKTITLCKDCFVHFVDGDYGIAFQRTVESSISTRQFWAGRPNDVGVYDIFAKANDKVIVRADAHIVAVTPLI